MSTSNGGKVLILRKLSVLQFYRKRGFLPPGSKILYEDYQKEMKACAKDTKKTLFSDLARKWCK